ncbi:MAG: rhomboid family intramembrane serine protease [Aquincola sp.]|nr:rhomboid family intramembrane serine protease [Aquincola sp.]MDH4287769.1 rhomboid family intramembrane serine protease [Aquincola sp.]MDH5330121.1 rhomboid family intramembrane serine protease [Aquincola sp.]
MPPLPPVTLGLILACVAAFFLDQLVPLVPAFALWPLTSGAFMPWQLVTYGLLHGNLAHLLFNMLGLWMFGSELERLWGRNRYLVFLLVSLVTAGLTQLLVTGLLGSIAYTVGASGALYGLLLAYAFVFPRRQFDLLGFLPMVLLMIPSTIFNVAGMVLFIIMLTNRSALPIRPIPMPAIGMVVAFGVIELSLGVAGRSGIAHFAHLGGMLGGLLTLRYWRGQPPFGGRRR